MIFFCWGLDSGGWILECGLLDVDTFLGKEPPSSSRVLKPLILKEGRFFHLIHDDYLDDHRFFVDVF